MEIAALQDFPEVLKILAEFTQITDKVKLLQLYNLMNQTDNVEKLKEEFQSILRSLPVDLVSSAFSDFLYPVSHFICPYVRFPLSHFEKLALCMCPSFKT